LQSLISQKVGKPGARGTSGKNEETELNKEGQAAPEQAEQSKRSFGEGGLDRLLSSQITEGNRRHWGRTGGKKNYNSGRPIGLLVIM